MEQRDLHESQRDCKMEQALQNRPEKQTESYLLGVATGRKSQRNGRKMGNNILYVQSYLILLSIEDGRLPLPSILQLVTGMARTRTRYV